MRKLSILIASAALSVQSFSTAFVGQSNKSGCHERRHPMFVANDDEDLKDKAIESASRIGIVSFALASMVLISPLPALADGQTGKFKLPPIDFSDKSRCVLQSSSMGQANAARDKLYDLRQCSLSGASAPGYDLSGVIMTNTDVSKADFKEAYFSYVVTMSKSNRVVSRVISLVLPLTYFSCRSVLSPSLMS